MDPVVGREEEIRRTIQILARKNPLVLIGEPGVGKSAAFGGLAQEIAGGRVPGVFKGKVVILLDLGSLVAGTRYRGEFEERSRTVIDEARGARGRIELSVDEGEILKPALARDEISLVEATTP